MKKIINCKNCNGHYNVREGKFGMFAGCSNYPDCKSTIKIPELAYEFLLKYGLNLYGWEKRCWKCQQETIVYSYFLYYELEGLDDFFSHIHGIGLGDIPSIDLLISEEIPSVKIQYSKTTNSRYMANSCIHCQSIQGRNYVVDDPHEIIGALWHDHDMDKYLIGKIKIDSPNLLVDLKKIIE